MTAHSGVGLRTIPVRRRPQPWHWQAHCDTCHWWSHGYDQSTAALVQLLAHLEET